MDQFKGKVGHQFMTFELWVHVLFDMLKAAKGCVPESVCP